MAKKPKRDNPAQSERFIKAARELGADEDDAVFVEKLKKVAKAKPEYSATRWVPLAPDQDYPPAPKGQLAVCHYRRNGGVCIYLPVETRIEADREFANLLQSDMVMRLPIQHGPRAGQMGGVIWIVESLGRGKWKVITGTDAAHENIKEWGLDGT